MAQSVMLHQSLTLGTAARRAPLPLGVLLALALVLLVGLIL
jgi:hypothetical protein